MARIAELFGINVEAVVAAPPEGWHSRFCPFTNRPCDVTANRGDTAFFNLHNPKIPPEDAQHMRSLYGASEIPLGICTVTTQRRYEHSEKPWIICPKRMLELRSVPPVLPRHIRDLIPIAPGTAVRCWWEFKFASSDLDNPGRFFEYTFDYILIPVSFQAGARHPTLIGPPYIIEVMTSSTRGGGLIEHMNDVLMLRSQRSLRGHVDSPYTPNYRQVFGRMSSQLFAKSEVAQAWGGRTVWVLQDSLLEYIEQTTAFRSCEFSATPNPDSNAFLAVYRLDKRDGQYALTYDRTLCGVARPRSCPSPDFTSMLGIGYAPPRQLLFDTLTRTQARTRVAGKGANWIDFEW